MARFCPLCRDTLDSINARYSSKYFGKERGVTAMTMSANYQALAFCFPSSNNYEGHYNLELYLMNQSNIQPDYQSSDSHGSNDINFALFDFFGCNFAPRFADLNHKMNFLYGSKDSYPEKYILKPTKAINTKIILEEEMNIKRVIASLGIKRATVSTVVKKINCSPKSNKTRKALSEFDKIIRSIYLLNYIDDIKLRQYVQKAINRQELYHKLRRRVGFDNGGKIMTKPDSKQIIYQECNRLICNMIVHYNSCILTEFLKQKQSRNQKKQIELLKKISPIAWRHINFYGRYDFKSKDGVNLEKIIELIDNISIA